MQTAAPSDALWEYARNIGNTDGEPAMWKVFDQCTREATAVPLRRGCWWGLYYWIVRVGVLTDTAKAKQALHAGSELSQALEAKLNERDRVELRESLGMVALFAGDHDIFDATAESGSIATHIRLGRVAGGARDWKRASTLLQQAHDKLKSPKPLVVVDLPLAVAQGFAGDAAGGVATITPLVGQGASPCENVQLLETAASLEMAAGHCPRGTDLRKQAADQRAQCTTSTWKGANRCKAPFAGTFPIEQSP
jgi:hypothetical protein